MENNLQKLIWDELRLISCSTGLKAQRIVMVTEPDIKKLCERLKDKVVIKDERGKD